MKKFSIVVATCLVLSLCVTAQGKKASRRDKYLRSTAKSHSSAPKEVVHHRGSVNASAPVGGNSSKAAAQQLQRLEQQSAKMGTHTTIGKSKARALPMPSKSRASADKTPPINFTAKAAKGTGIKGGGQRRGGGKRH
jgi:hypothetical protein